MENKLYTETFENFLRESTDDFRMHPSKRVWNSLYNNMHPARKWPSVAVLLILISSMMFVGVSNTTKISKKPTLQISSNNSVNTDLALVESNDEFENENVNNAVSDYHSENIPEINTLVTNQELINNNVTNKKNIIKDKKLFTFQNQNNLKSNFKLTLESTESTESLYSKDIESKVSNEDVNSEKSTKKINDLVDQINENQKNKLAFEFYATPSIGYRTYSSNNDGSSYLSRSANSGYSSSNDNALNHSSSLNLEAGGNVLFSLSDNMRIKAGLQVNYTNYSINAYELSSPSFNTLLINDLVKNQPALSTRSSNLSSVPQSGNQVSLNNNTYQLSLPFGADFKLAGNSLIEWYAGATLQPTFVAGGNAYMLSSESHNYVNEGSAIRSFNLNGGFETFVSYKLKEGFILNAGPQIRYQFLSTYSDKYMLNEKLYNLGVKLGVTTNF